MRIAFMGTPDFAVDFFTPLQIQNMRWLAFFVSLISP